MQLSGVTEELHPQAYALFKLLKARRELFGIVVSEDTAASIITFCFRARSRAQCGVSVLLKLTGNLALPSRGLWCLPWSPTSLPIAFLPSTGPFYFLQKVMGSPWFASAKCLILIRSGQRIQAWLVCLPCIILLNPGQAQNWKLNSWHVALFFQPISYHNISKVAWSRSSGAAGFQQQSWLMKFQSSPIHPAADSSPSPSRIYRRSSLWSHTARYRNGRKKNLPQNNPSFQWPRSQCRATGTAEPVEKRTMKRRRGQAAQMREANWSTTFSYGFSSLICVPWTGPCRRVELCLMKENSRHA